MLPILHHNNILHTASHTTRLFSHTLHFTQLPHTLSFTSFYFPHLSHSPIISHASLYKPSLALFTPHFSNHSLSSHNLYFSLLSNPSLLPLFSLLQKITDVLLQVVDAVPHLVYSGDDLVGHCLEAILHLLQQHRHVLRELRHILGGGGEGGERGGEDIGGGGVN